MIVEFEGNRFSGRLMPELDAAREKGIIRVVDLFFLQKDEEGNIPTAEFSDTSGEDVGHYSHLVSDNLRWLSQDIELTVSFLPNNSSAALLLFEHTWAIGLREAIMDAGVNSLTGGLVAPDMLQMVEKAGESGELLSIRRSD